MNIMLAKKKGGNPEHSFLVFFQDNGYPPLLYYDQDKSIPMQDLLFPRKFKELGFDDPDYRAILSQVTAGLLANPNIVKKLDDLDLAWDFYNITQKAEEIAVWMYYDTPYTEFI